MPAIDPLELRRALGAFMTGVTVVTTIDESGSATGFTANSFTSVSLDEPLVLFCLAGNSSNREIYLNAGKFAMNVLGEDQRSISNTFASPRAEDRFAGVEWSTAATGSPILAGSAAWFDCTLHETVEAGDHVIVIGKVLAFDSSAANPLGYWKGNYVTALLEHQATDVPGVAGHVGAVIECEDRVLLVEDPDKGQVMLPFGTHIGGEDQPESLLGKLAALGVTAEVGFVFSVFEDGIIGAGDSEGVMVYYRGTAQSADTLSSLAAWYSHKDIPWDKLPNQETDTMLHRYFDESMGGRYSVYVGDSEQGQVHTLK
ncbi:MAG: flavin reductase family protein [Pseudomonadota bacterium]